MSWLDHTLYALLWLSFGLIHSLTARSGVKAFLLPLLRHYYRLAYNVFALVYYLTISAIGTFWLSGDAGRFDFLPLTSGFLLALQITGIGLFLYALTHYDLGLFSGTRQAKHGVSDKEEPLSFSGLHQYVRHPLYSAAHLYFWGGVREELTLTTAIWGSLYLLVGSMFEERALTRQYGAPYVEYLKKVPALIPWKGRVGV
jgi:protein-S-isoprenylcysteine O-methyltransferase Ste14